MSPVKVLSVALPVLFLLLQLERPELKSSVASADLQAPADVKQILRTSCYPCHSNETRLLWFDEIVPAYWVVVRDVRKARKQLNFSELGTQPKAHQRAVLFESLNQIQIGAMPLPSYRRLHPEAVITPAQLSVLRSYLLPATFTSRTPEPDAAAVDAQYRSWIAAAAKPRLVAAAPNGIAFLPDYKNWKAISSTDRVDTTTLRIILGNDVAVRAIAANNINPWPDGTAFAKVAWLQQPVGNGVAQTGAFLQVAFMIKNKAKYASSAGWGWATWVGTELKPYGTGPDFSKECVACHLPLSKNDYVFTMPIPALRSAK
jgi:hypothetical protein